MTPSMPRPTTPSIGPQGSPRAAAAPDRHGGVPSHRGRRWVPACSSLGPRRESRRVRRSRYAKTAPPTGGRRPVRRVGSHRVVSRRRSARGEVHAVEARGERVRTGCGATPPAHRSSLTTPTWSRCLPEFSGGVDIVVANPPYIPAGARMRDPEVAVHDPASALWAGPDGLDAMRVLEANAARLLQAGWIVVAEHADIQEVSALTLFAETGRWLDVADHPDLAGRPRYLTARRGLTRRDPPATFPAREPQLRLHRHHRANSWHRRRDPRRAARASSWYADRHGLRARLRRVQCRGGHRPVGGQGTGAGHAGAGAGRVTVDAGGNLGSDPAEW